MYLAKGSLLREAFYRSGLGMLNEPFCLVVSCRIAYENVQAPWSFIHNLVNGST